VPHSAATGRRCGAGPTIRRPQSRTRESLERFGARLDSVDVTRLSAEDALNRELLAERVRVALEALRFDEERVPFISGDGFYTTADYAALNTVLNGEADAEAWLARLAAIPAYYGPRRRTWHAASRPVSRSHAGPWNVRSRTCTPRRSNPRQTPRCSRLSRRCPSPCRRRSGRH